MKLKIRDTKLLERRVILSKENKGQDPVIQHFREIAPAENEAGFDLEKVFEILEEGKQEARQRRDKLDEIWKKTGKKLIV